MLGVENAPHVRSRVNVEHSQGRVKYRECIYLGYRANALFQKIYFVSFTDTVDMCRWYVKLRMSN